MDSYKDSELVQMHDKRYRLMDLVQHMDSKLVVAMRSMNIKTDQENLETYKRMHERRHNGSFSIQLS